MAHEKTWETASRHTTVMGVVPFDHPDLPGGPFFIVVHNIADGDEDDGGKPAGWGLPGGGSEEGEDAPTTFVREAHAEAGLEINPAPTTVVRSRTNIALNDSRADRVRYSRGSSVHEGNFAHVLGIMDPSEDEEATLLEKVALEVPQGSLLANCQKRLAEFFLEAAKAGLQSEYGIFRRFADEEEARRYGVKEVNEVDGLGLVARSTIERLDNARDFWAFIRATGVYPSHAGILQSYCGVRSDEPSD